MPALSKPMSFTHLLASTSALAMLVAGALATPAAETIIANGATVTQQLVPSGDTLTVQAGGKIDEPNLNAVQDTAAGTVTINNQGNIFATTSSAIYAGLADVILNNSSLVIGQINGVSVVTGSASISNIGAGATIGGGTGMGVVANNISVVDNSGTIQGTSGISSTLGITTLTNSGSIQGSTGLGVGTLGSITTLTNASAGVIHGGDVGVQATTIATLVNAGVIHGGNFGIQSDIGSIGSLTNSGTITGGGDAIRESSIDSLTNEATGIITGTGSAGIEGLNAFGSITNAGVINGHTSGIFIQASLDTLINSASGTITGGNTSGVIVFDSIAKVDNSGTITGFFDGVNTADLGELTNSGTIAGGALGGVHASKIGTITNTVTGIISGTHAVNSDVSIDTIDNAGKMLGSNTGINSSGVIATITNSGTINGTLYGIVGANIGSVDNTGTIGGGGTGINIATAGSVTNSGTITGDDGINTGTLTSLTNTASGLIIGGARGVSGASFGTIQNAGTISGKQGFNTVTIGSLVNTGTITGTLTHAIEVTNLGSLVNDGGAITGVTHGIMADVGGKIGSLTNSGTIAGTTGYGIMAGGDVGSIHNSGTINGAVNAGVSADTIGTVVNNGTISGGTFALNATSIGSVTNNGSIAGGSDGINFVTLTNLANTATGVISGASRAVTAIASIGSVQNAGMIAGGYGFNVNNSIGTLVNTGTITGTAAHAIIADKIDVLSNDGGNITGQMNGVFAVTNLGDLYNNGNISGGQDGVSSDGTIGTITNSGTISGSATYGVRAMTSINSIVNAASGHISSGSAAGVLTTTLHSLVNAGRIDGQYGIEASLIENVSNTGTIAGSASGIVTGGLLNLTNSGTIAAGSPAGYAILEGNPALATDTVLTLNAGSVLIGHVDIHGGNNTLNVGGGLNLALTFDSSVPEVIATGRSAHVVVGNTVYVADTQAYAAAGGAAMADLSGGLAGVVGAALDKGFDEKGIDGSSNYWLEAVGGLGAQPGRDGGPSVRNSYAGFAAGADFGPDADTRFGGFLGAARGGVDNGAQTIDTDSFYAGIYGGGQFEDFAVKGTLSAGYGHGASSRVVANNTVVTGLETATSAGDSYFISPGIVLTKPWVTQDLSFQTSLGLNYTGVFSGGSSENLATGIALDAATTHIFEGEGLVKLPMQQQTESGLLTGDAHAGIVGRAILNPDQTGTLTGVATSFGTASVTATAGIVAGGALALKLDGGATLFGGLDATLRSDSSASLSANAGFKASF